MSMSMSMPEEEVVEVAMCSFWHDGVIDLELVIIAGGTYRRRNESRGVSASSTPTSTEDISDAVGQNDQGALKANLDKLTTLYERLTAIQNANTTTHILTTDIPSVPFLRVATGRFKYSLAIGCICISFWSR